MDYTDLTVQNKTKQRKRKNQEKNKLYKLVYSTLLTSQ